MLWLSHLLLAPFDLASVSDQFPRHESVKDLGLSHGLPNVVRRLITIGLVCIKSVTKEQDAAAKMLVRLVNRPDMQQLGLPRLLVSWGCETITSSSTDVKLDMNACIGPLRFLVGMTVSPDTDQTSVLVPDIYSLATQLFDNTSNDSVNSSAVVKKQVLKAVRNIATLSLKTTHEHLQEFCETNGVLENVIDMLLRSLSDRDTPVRFAAAKAISTIVTKLDPQMGYEVIQAVIDELATDVPVRGTSNSAGAELDLSMANPLKWHGLTLTLAYNLFRRTASPAQLPEIISALLPALSFEQRATTGQSIGTNVRDAACFGLWALSRRYTTAELLLVKVENITTKVSTEKPISVIQFVAIQLLISACLDPAGNVRRACSAALQELIGRHPDQVHEGISLVQIVDYQAVGLRRRAMIDVARKASILNIDYWQALTSKLLDWRGLAAQDVLSREAAALSIGQLCSEYAFDRWTMLLSHIKAKLLQGTKMPVEERHGALLALTAIIDELHMGTVAHAAEPLLEFWPVFINNLSIFMDFTPRAIKAELFSATARTIVLLAGLATKVDNITALNQETAGCIAETANSFFGRSEASILDNIPAVVRALHQIDYLLDNEESLLKTDVLIRQLEHDAKRPFLHGAGNAIALGAASSHLSVDPDLKSRIMDALASLRNASIVEWRVVGLQALRLTMPHLAERTKRSDIDLLCSAVAAGLDDYTITERGDVGSLVRLQAIEVVTELWHSYNSILNEEQDIMIRAKILRLSLEKLDRVRLSAYQCLQGNDIPVGDAKDVSSVTYFKTTLSPLISSTCAYWQREALIQGLLSSAGSGNEALLQASRTALIAVLSSTSEEPLTSFLTTLMTILKTQIASQTDTTPTLELLAYLFDSLPLLDLVSPDFKWRNMLSYVQKSHFKSTLVGKIVAAVDVYRGLAAVEAVRDDVVKKLTGMARTNPYSRVRIAAVEALWCLTGNELLKEGKWMDGIGAREKDVLAKLEEQTAGPKG